MSIKSISKYSLAIAVILILASLTRTIRITDSFWLDEAAQAIESARPLSQQLDIIPDFQPPLYHLIVHLWMYGGLSEWWLRLTSLIPGLITLYVTIRLGEKLFNRHTALIAGIFLATSQFHIFYSQELRPYSLAAMWGVIMIDALHDWWFDKKTAPARFFLSALVGIYTMYVFPVLLITALLATYIFHRNKIKPLLIAYVGLFIAFLPWLPTFWAQLQVGTNLSAASSVWSQIVSPPLWKMLPLTGLKFLVGRLPFDRTFTDIFMIGVMGAVSAFLFNRAFQHKHAKFVSVWLIVPVLLAFIVSVKVPVLDPKRVLFCLPFLYLLLAAGIGRGIKSLVVTIIIVSINMLAVSEYANNPQTQREPWRAAVAEVEQAADLDSLVVFAFPEPFAPWRWYQQKNLPAVSIGNPGSQVSELMWLAAAAQRTDQVYVFDYLMDMTDPDRKIITALETNGLEEQAYIQYPGIGKIRLFSPVKNIAYE